MNLLTLTTLLTLTIPSLTAPPPSKDTPENAPNATGNHFYLKTSGATKSAYNNLYVSAYHTGAGLNDPVMTKTTDVAAKAYMNGTNTLFDLGTQFPWGLVLRADTNYADWDPVRINAGAGTEGFDLKQGKLVGGEYYGWGGWLVCHWYHGNAPQLFYLYSYRDENGELPSSCSEVQLTAEHI